MSEKKQDNKSELTIPRYGKYEVEKCQNKFKSLILDNRKNLPLIKQQLTSLAINCHLHEELIRPTAWKLFLKTLSFNENITLRKWIEETFQKRENYKKKLFEVKAKFLQQQAQSKDGKDEKGFSNFEENSSIKHLIEIDVERTYGDIPLFKDEYIRNMEQEILYVFSQENKPTSYKQGMNEILAMFIHSFYPFYTTSPTSNYTPEKFDLWCSKPEKYLNQIYTFFHDENELQSDLYYVLYNAMNMGLNKFYEDDIDPESKKDDKKTYLLLRCDYILDKLRKHNQKLYNHFMEIGLSAEVILQRWLKCIFSREFTLEDCVFIWDNIFGNEFNISSKNLEYIDYFCVAMFDYISDSLLTHDQNECFLCLFKYPPFQTIDILVGWAEKVKGNILNIDKPSFFSSSLSNLKNKIKTFEFTGLFGNNEEEEGQRKAAILDEMKSLTNNKSRIIQLKNIINKYKSKFNADDRMRIDLILTSLEQNV